MLARRAGVVAAFTLGSRVLGYVRDAALAHAFGAGGAFDAFVAAQTIPNVLRRLVAEGTLMIAYIPLLAEEREKGGLPAMRQFTSAVLGVLIPVLLILVGLGLAFPQAAVALFASGFDPARAEMAAELTAVMMPYLFFISLVAVASGALNTVGVFAPPAAAPMLLNVSIIGVTYGFASWFEPPILAAAWGFTVGGVAQLLLQIVPLARRGLLVVPRIDLRHPALRSLGARLLPALFGVGVYQLNMIVIRQIASYLPGGQLSCYFYATRLEEFALGVFAVSIGVAALPTMSDHAARRDAGALEATFRRALLATQFITVVAMAGLFILAEPIVGTLFRHGRFDASSAALTADLVRMMSLSLVPVGALRVMVPTYYALGDTRTPVLAAAASLATTAGLGLSLGPWLEIRGLTLATVVAAIVQASLLAFWLRGRLKRAFAPVSSPQPIQAPLPAAELRSGPDGRQNPPGLIGHGLRCLFAVAPPALLAAAMVRGFPWLDGPSPTGVLLLGAAGSVLVVGYGLIAARLGVSEPAAVLAAAKKRWRRR